MWIIEHENYKNGDYIRVGEKYRLKHLSSGRYLTVIRGKPPEEKYILALNMEKDCEDNSLFQFCKVKNILENEESGPLDEENLKLLKDSFVYIRNVKTNLWVTAKELLTFSSKETFEEEFSYMIEPALLKRISEKDTFRLYCASSNELWELNFLLSCFSSLYSFSRVIEKMQNVEYIYFSINKIYR